MYTTMKEAAEAAVSRGECPATFDYALPVAWADQVRAETGTWPNGFVWGYPPRSIFGHPVPVTDEARKIYARLPQALR